MARLAARKLADGLAAGSKRRDAVDKANTMAELVDILPDIGSTQTSPSKFVSLYMALPKSSRDGLMSSQELLDLYYNSQWIRTSVSLEGEVATAHFVDGNNQILRSVPLPEALIRAESPGGQRVIGDLSSDPRFIGRLHTAERFFAILFQLPEQERIAIFPDPEMLLGLPKPVTWVGLGLTDNDPIAQVGFESSSSDGPVVTIYPISTKAFQRLSFLLAWADSDTLFRDQDIPEQPDKSRERKPF